jgi:hypothetical protein
MRMALLSAFTLLGATLAPVAAIRAQSTPTPAPAPAPVAVGERVRIATAAQYGKFRYVGRVVAVNDDTVQVQSTGPEGTRSVAVADMRMLEVSAGTQTNGRKGMLYGSIVGAGIGAIIGAATYKEPPPCDLAIFCPEPDIGRGGDALAGAIGGGLVGLAAGGLWGSAHRSERWIRRPLGSGYSLRLLPAHAGGAAFRVTRRF